MREPSSQHSLSMTQNDRLSTEIHFLHLRPLAVISLRIPWDFLFQPWANPIYTWLTHPVLDPTHSGRVTMDNLMKLVTTALEWTYEAQGTNVRAERLKS